VLSIAQGTPQEETEKPGMMGKTKEAGMHGRRAEMRKMHEQMEAMHKEMMEDLQKQLTALHEHSKALDGISDDKQLLTELKKHQQMTDHLLGTMVEQRAKMHAHMQAQREQMREQRRQRKEKAAERKKTKTEAHDAHHGEE
jgi:hypothetical protein